MAWNDGENGENFMSEIFGFTQYSRRDTLKQVKDSNKVVMDYEKIKEKLLEIQEMMREVPQNCKGDSHAAFCHRRKYLKVKLEIQKLIDIL